MTDSTPDVSVVVCTHNRAAHLARAIGSVWQQDLPRSAYELIVVDNASTDDTAAQLRSNPDIVYVYEPRLGLSHARNAGCGRARAPFIALLDDDAIADRHWLSYLLAAFRQTPTPACVGGRVTPVFERARPAWLSDDVLLSMTTVDWPGGPHAIEDLTKEWLVGANIAFRSDVLRRLGGFSPRLGRVGARLLSGEEIHVQRRIIAEGLTCWYEPRATVEHVIPAARLQRSWCRRRYFAQGVTDAVVWTMEKRPHEKRLARAREELLPLAGASLAVPRMLWQQDSAAFSQQCGVLWRLGFVAGLLGIAP